MEKPALAKSSDESGDSIPANNQAADSQAADSQPAAEDLPQLVTRQSPSASKAAAVSQPLVRAGSKRTATNDDEDENDVVTTSYLLCDEKVDSKFRALDY